MDGDDADRLWGLVVDLSTQLNLNRKQLTSLQQQVETLKAQSVHSNTGFALRRFNVDVSKEKFDSELEKLNAHLVQENNDLRWENKMGDKLIKEYEQCLEVIMKKFRSFSYATQQHTLQLTQHYEDLLSTNTHNAAAASLHATTSLSSTLSHLGTLVRAALREVDGEGEGAEYDAHRAQQAATSQQGVSGQNETDTSSDAGPSVSNFSSSDPRWFGSGGYTGKVGDIEARRSEAAMTRAIEMEVLRHENDTLRKLLDLAEGKGLDVGFGKEKLSLGVPRGRKGSESVIVTSPQPPAPGPSTASPRPVARFNAADMTAVPNAPLPTASIASPSPTPTPPPAPPSTVRTPLQERIQQIAGTIRVRRNSRSGEELLPSLSSADPLAGLPTSSSSSLSSSLSEGLPLASPSTATQSLSQGSVLIPTPPDSAPAHSDIRSAALLPMSVSDASPPEAGPSTQLPASEGNHPMKLMPEAAAEDAIDLSEEEGQARSLTSEASTTEAPLDVPRDTADLTGHPLGAAEAVREEQGDTREEAVEEDEEIDLSDPPGEAVFAQSVPQATHGEPIAEAAEEPHDAVEAPSTASSARTTSEAASEVAVSAATPSSSDQETAPINVEPASTEATSATPEATAMNNVGQEKGEQQRAEELSVTD